MYIYTNKTPRPHQPRPNSRGCADMRGEDSETSKSELGKCSEMARQFEDVNWVQDFARKI